jgi:cytochrome c5
MKRFFLLTIVMGMLLILIPSALSPAKPSGKKSTTLVKSTAIPDDLKTVFKNSCMGCHASGGNHMAMSKLNFSKWDNYKPGKQAKKAEAICKMISKDAMPPKSFRKEHPDAIPTQSQKDKICMWSKTMAQQK